jgi:hypothetical protein
MENADVLAIQSRIEAVLPTLKEYQRRRYLSAEAQSIGYGGISLISRISGMSRQTLTEGVKELNYTDRIMPDGRSRRPGGGRKPVRETQPGILEALEGIVSAHTKGDPMTTLLWTNKSLRNLEKGVVEICIYIQKLAGHTSDECRSCGCAYRCDCHFYRIISSLCHR